LVYPSFVEMKILFGSATFPLKEEGKLVNYPLLMECEGYEAEKGGAVRVSLRGGNGNSPVSVYQQFIAFFCQKISFYDIYHSCLHVALLLLLEHCILWNYHSIR
jgi:hypothetical protein